MDQTEYRWPNRCLPLLMANESAWWILNPHGFTVRWHGGDHQSSLEIAYDDDLPGPQRLANSDFGLGIVTWGIPYIISTEPGWDLLVRGPANFPKDGATPLEGLVETDWSAATFTMNWKITRADAPVRFEAGEPFCALVPQRRHDLETIEPRVRELAENPHLHAAHMNWGSRRRELSILKFVSQYGQVDGVAPDSWQKDYFKGRLAGGSDAPEHRTKRQLKNFSRP